MLMLANHKDMSFIEVGRRTFVKSGEDRAPRCPHG